MKGKIISKKWAIFGENGGKNERQKGGRKLRKRETKWGQIGGKLGIKRGQKRLTNR